MPTPQPASFTAGTVISASAVAAGVTGARDYLNGAIVDDDFEEEGIGFEDIRRPLLLGYPFLILDGECQGAVFRAAGLGDTQAPQGERDADASNNRIAREAERASLFPLTIAASGEQQVLKGSAARFDVDQDGVVDVLLTTKLEAFTSWGSAARDFYCGVVYMYYRNNTTDPTSEGTPLEGTRRVISLLAVDGALTWFDLTTQFVVEPGVYDVWLALTGPGDPEVVQIIASGTTLSVELHITG